MVVGCVVGGAVVGGGLHPVGRLTVALVLAVTSPPGYSQCPVTVMVAVACEFTND